MFGGSNLVLNTNFVW